MNETEHISRIVFGTYGTQSHTLNYSNNLTKLDNSLGLLHDDYDKSLLLQVYKFHLLVHIDVLNLVAFVEKADSC